MPSEPSSAFMRERNGIEEIRAEALRKLGRNVVNFQKVEACLKCLVAMCDIAGAPTTVAERQRTKVARARRQSLGELADGFVRGVFGDDVAIDARAYTSEIWLSIALRIKAGPGEVRRRRRDLVALVAERNRLIHHDLIHFDHGSLEGCRALIDKLDAQNPRILDQLNALGAMIDTFKQSLAGIQSLVESDAFIEQLRLDVSDA